MHASTHRSHRGLRLGVCGVFIIGLAAMTILWQQGRAGSRPFEPQVAAVFDKGELHVGVGLEKATVEPLEGTLTIQLITGTGEVLGEAAKSIHQEGQFAQHKISFKADSEKAQRLGLRITFGQRKQEMPLRNALLAKAHETTLSAGAEYAAGSRVAIRCGVHGVQSLAESMPLPGSDILIRVKDKAGKSYDLSRAKTGRTGLANIEFDMPSLDAGNYDLEVVTKSALGEETLSRQIKIKADAKILLVSDRPIYQPGHMIHLRALALRAFDQKPIGDKDILFEVEDSKGNKVFKRTFKTNDFGVASVDFQLADEVNMGDYHLRAFVGEAKSEKTVNVKRYVLPKFKVNVTADKKFYLPKETIKAELQSDYFFGKPVAKAKIEVTASTFDVAFRKFQTWNGSTDENGHAKFEIQLPDYFVGQPLQKGDALVKLEVKVLDTADHSETIAKSFTVSDQPIRVSLIPEGGKLAPGLENRIFAAAIYPDGSPAANCDVQVWHRKNVAPPPVVPGAIRGAAPAIPGGALPVALVEEPAGPGPKPAAQDLGKPIATAKTNAAGLAEIKITPKAEQFRQGPFGQHDVETLGGKQISHGPSIIFDVRAQAKDPKGNTAAVNIELNSHPLGENVLLRLDKAVYQTGDIVNIDVRTSAGLPTVYVDVVRSGQIMLSRWLDVKDGQASQKLDLPSTIYGSIEIHAYQMLAGGEIIRDSRVAYVQPKNDLKIDVKPATQYAPGEDARIRFTVTNSAGAPTQAALGVIVVDEAVYALQEMQPGLEKLYFTLQEELMKPQVQIKFSEGIDNIVLQPALPQPRQQIAEVLLTSVKLPAPQRWNVAPAAERRQRLENQVASIGQTLYWYAVDPNGNFQEFDKNQRFWVFRKGLLDDLVKTRGVPPQWLEGVFGGKLTLDELRGIERNFIAMTLARAVTAQRLHQAMWSVIHYTNQNPAKFKKNNEWVLSDNMLDEVIKAQRLHPGYAKDAWGQPFRVVKRTKKLDGMFGNGQFDYYDLVSLGADGALGSPDDLNRKDARALHTSGRQDLWWMDNDRIAKLGDRGQFTHLMRGQRREQVMMLRDGAMMERANFAAPGAAGIGGGPRGGIPPPMAAAPAKTDAGARPMEMKDAKSAGTDSKGGGGEAAITKVRDYFPETMLWQPSLITDDKGIADLSVNFADSITTWRLSASANAKSGALGGATVPLKVFQDFFVDIDLPVSLTQSDEVAFPVAIYNYLKEPQKLKIELQEEAWFQLLDSPLPGGGKGSGVRGFVRTIDVKPGDVTAVKFRIKANKIGYQPLTVKAYGSKKSDAVKRVVEVVPNGQKVEKVVSDRLSGADPKAGAVQKFKHVIDIPQDAIPDASKLIVRIYPGVMAQVLEGVEGMIRLPGG